MTMLILELYFIIGEHNPTSIWVKVVLTFLKNVPAATRVHIFIVPFPINRKTDSKEREQSTYSSPVPLQEVREMRILLPLGQQQGFSLLGKEQSW